MDSANIVENEYGKSDSPMVYSDSDSEKEAIMAEVQKMRADLECGLDQLAGKVDDL